MSSATRTTDDAFQDVLLALFQLHGRVLEAADAMSGGFGLTGARWQVLKVLARQSLTVSQIARRLGLKRQSVQRTVDQLAALRLVELQPNVDHQQAWLGRCLRGLARTDLERLAESLGALTGRVEAATAREPDADRPRTSRIYRRWGVAP
jgi:DNA-binding transcriptional ArsR family regulator